MMPTQDYSQQVHAAFTSLRNGLRPFVEQEMKTVHQEHWLEECQRAGVRPNREGNYTWDVMALLKVISNAICWRDVFAMKNRRGAKERGLFVTLLEWRHEFKGHDDQNVSQFAAQEVIEHVVYALRCIDAKAELEVSEELLRLLPPQPEPQLALPTTSFPQTTLPKSKPQVKGPSIGSSGEVTVPAEFEPLQTNRTTDFLDAHQFDFADALNEDIWRFSPELQQQIQPWETLRQPGVIGAQQAMLDSTLLAERGPLPWVPDLVGKDWRDERCIVFVGTAYAGFIREYSKRSTMLSLSQYLAASSMQDFQKLFLKDVVQQDPSYYSHLQNLCSILGNASRFSFLDLCRVSLVKRGSGEATRSDNSSSGIIREAPVVFEEYVENEQAAEWLWRRFTNGEAKCVVALGLIAEHGLLRLFAQHGMTISEKEKPFSVSHKAYQAWSNEYADPNRQLSYWLKLETWWTVRGQVDGVERVWYVLPVYHPAWHQNRDAGYQQTKKVLQLMLAAAGST